MPVIFALQRYRFVWQNLLLMGYFWLLHPLILQRLVASTPRAGPDWLMGGLLLGIQVIEMIGMLLKRPLSAYYTRHDPDSSRPGSLRESLKIILFVFTPIFHLCLAAVLTSVALGSLKMGMGKETTASLECLSVLLFFIVLTKEAFFVTLLLSIGIALPAPEPRPQFNPPWVERLNRWLSPPEITHITPKDAVKDLAGDLMLLAFAALVYTTVWDFIIGSSPLRAQGIELLFAYLGVSLFFFMLYFANGSVYWMQSLGIRQSRVAQILSWVSFLAVWLTALWLIPTH